MADHVYDWLQAKAMGWIPSPPVNKIDTHHHFVPDFYAKAVTEAGGDPSGWPTPRWTPLSSELVMKRLGIKRAILSCTAPGACILEGEASYDLTRQLNLYAADLQAALAELRFALGTLKADGVVIFTRYGDANTYLGHPILEPIWAEFHKRKVVVFVHPTHPVDKAKVNDKLLQPMIDYPHETTRAAMDMIMMGTRQKYSDCKVILSHAGGALPYLISRCATPLRKAPGFAASYVTGTTHEKVMQDFRSMYYDVALSASPQVLDMLFKMVPHDHILYGRFPYAPPPAYPAFIEDLESYEMDSEKRDKINFKNATVLFQGLEEE
ncbi:hypothetical protein VE00_05228 [Pseudogymnoascus sp. WSF 3629]|nr:hypothetical protein VE00_05228 [Pseudogymnoascus sp. WSF 3629]